MSPAGYFNAEVVSPEAQTRKELDRAIDVLILMDEMPLDDSKHEQAANEAFRAIHNYCDMQGVGFDEAGMHTRVNYAQAIDYALKSGNTDLLQDITQTPVEQFIKQIMDVSPDAIGEISEENKQRYSQYANVRSINTAKERSSLGERTKRPERRARKHRIRNAIGAVAMTAVAVAAVFGVSRHSDDEEYQASIPEGDRVTVEFVIPANEVIDPPDNESSTTAVPMPEFSEEVAPQSPEPAQHKVISIPEGSNLWNQLQILAVDTDGSVADQNLELERIIADALSPIAMHNHTTVDALGNVSVGQQLEIPPQVIQSLKSAAV